ncbi:hypothetical protein ACFWN7_07755 [Agromyces sp. NPDC058484]|uniref:NrtR DNA-binding winged helix domain-containing protein n=1 Tax=Agromyces sp. NPDC058484 TaxID=3346524 RepID=UPI0036639EC2
MKREARSGPEHPDRHDEHTVFSCVGVSPDMAAERAIVVPVAELGPLGFDHAEIVALAVARLRREYRRRPDPFELLDQPFTMRDLQRLHEAVAGERLMRDTLRRRMEPLLEPIGALTHGTMGKPAREFRTRG